MDTQSSSSSGGLWKRQSTLDTNAGADGASANASTMEIESVDDATPFLGSTGSDVVLSSSDLSLSQEETFKLYGHIALSFLFLVASASIVPVFAAAEDESWRSNNVPFQKTAAGDVILDFELNHPLVDPPTVTANMLIATAAGGPLLFILCVNLFNLLECKRTVHPLGRVQMHELRASLCSLFLSLGLSETVTCTLKLYVSRHRPNFYALCGFDPITLECMASPLARVHEATLSFPSGHSSLSFCGMTYMMYFLLGRVSLINSSTCVTLSSSGGKVIKLAPYKSLLGVLSCIVPWSYSFFVATSRIVDNWHHPSDVIAGTLLGIACATIGYHAFYPSTTASASGKSGIPLSLQSNQ